VPPCEVTARDSLTIYYAEVVRIWSK